MWNFGMSDKDGMLSSPSLSPLERARGMRVVLQALLISFQVVLCVKSVENSPHDKLCLTSSQVIPVIWDCTGYYQCTPLGDGLFRAVWTRCVAGSHFDPAKNQCVTNYDKCLSPREAAFSICPSMPNLKYRHPSSCAMYFDCSQRNPLPGLEPWENECPSPLLFDEDTLKCVETTKGRNSQLCGSRPVPDGECGYKLACREFNCTGREDGYHLDPMFPFSENFYVCSNGSLAGNRSCASGLIFDPELRQCVETVRQDSVQGFCSRNPSAIFADPERCSLLYDCSQASWHISLKPYQTECAYPRLFDRHTSRCASFQDVSCDLRQETVQPCDYLVGHCVNAGCLPCSASCLGLPDGANAYPGRVLTEYFLVCARGRTIDIRTCHDGTIFDPQLRACLSEISSQTLDIYCANMPNGRLLHPTECSVFYNCGLANNTQTNQNLPVRSVECKYPYLVDAGTISCKPHTLVKCGARREPLSPCDYVSNRCRSGACAKCELVMPSCIGKSDNFYPAVNNEMTADFIICKDQRVSGSGTCPNGTIFDMRTLACTDTVYPLSLAEFCANYPSGRVPDPQNCGQYYDCSVSTHEISECSYPDLFDVVTRQCLPYGQVNCGGRPVFLDPCDSRTFCPLRPCPYCTSSYPSCIGRNGQTGGFVFEPSMYYECVNDRMALKYCQTVFNSSAGVCDSQNYTSATPEISASWNSSENNLSVVCQINPRHVHIKVDNCGQFYNCSRPNSPLGDFVDECQVGDLFDPSTNQCIPYNEVTCKDRYEPKQVCDYERMCPNRTSGGCAKCQDLYPLCSNTSDGKIPTNEIFPSGMVHCISGRAVNVTVCPIGQFYDNSLERCSNVLRDEAVKQVCKDHPQQLLEHPVHCAKYIKCGTPREPGRSGNVTFSVAECQYPLLFSRGSCASYKTTECGRRKESIDPCEYEELRKCPGKTSTCIVRSANTCPDTPDRPCVPCKQRYPSCLGRPDGYWHYPGRLFTSDFVKCEQGRILSILKCEKSVFNPETRKCGLSLDTVINEAHDRTQTFCTKFPEAVIQHPTHCARYYNCSAPAGRDSRGADYLQECRYPQMFNKDLGVCSNFREVLKTVGCGNKTQPRHYCDYVSVCPSQRFPTCSQCRRALPSCENKVNGIHGNPPGYAVTKGFMYCVEGRVLAVSPCPQGTMFHQSVKSCVRIPATPNPGRG